MDKMNTNIRKLHPGIKGLATKMYLKSVTNYFAPIAAAHILDDRGGTMEMKKKINKYTDSIDKLARNFIKKITPELTWKDKPDGWNVDTRKIRIETVEAQWNIRSTRDFFYVRMCGLVHAKYWHLGFGDLPNHIAHNLIISDPPITTIALNALGDLPSSGNILNDKISIFPDYYKKDRWNDTSILWHNLINKNINVLIFNRTRKRLERKICRLCYQRIRSNLHYLDCGRLKNLKRFANAHQQTDTMKEDIIKTYQVHLCNLWKRGKREGFKIDKEKLKKQTNIFIREIYTMYEWFV
jgi:hypothetical protein